MRDRERWKEMEVGGEGKWEKIWYIERLLSWSSHLILCFNPTSLACLKYIAHIYIYIHILVFSHPKWNFCCLQNCYIISFFKVSVNGKIIFYFTCVHHSKKIRQALATAWISLEKILVKGISHPTFLKEYIVFVVFQSPSAFRMWYVCFFLLFKTMHINQNVLHCHHHCHKVTHRSNHTIHRLAFWTVFSRPVSHLGSCRIT